MAARRWTWAEARRLKSPSCVLLVAALALGLVACQPGRSARKFGSTCGSGAECGSGLCTHGFCSLSCGSDADCGGEGFCTSNVCVPPDRMDEFGAGADAAGTSDTVGVSGDTSQDAASGTCVLHAACTVTNSAGSCPGTVLDCSNDQPNCIGPIPAPESCNGADDNCDGQTDEAGCDDGNPCTVDLCASGACKHVQDASTNGVACGEGRVCVASWLDDPALVARWSFDGCSGVDGGLGHHDGVLSGGVTCVDGAAGKALLFDGETGSLLIAADPALDVTLTGLTVGAWLRNDGTGDYTVALGKEYAWELGHIGGSLAAAVAHDEKNQWKWQQFGELPVGGWVPVAVTYDGTTLTYFVGGKAVGSVPMSGPVPATQRPILLGARLLGDSNVPVQFWRGALDEAFVLRRALAPADVAQLAASVTDTATVWTGGCVRAGL